MTNKQNWNDSLDEMLEKLNNGAFVDQSISEFEKTINRNTSNTYNYSNSSSSNYRRTSNTASGSAYSSTYRTAIPHVNRTVESQSYPSRYLQVITCLESIIYDRYPDSKLEGYRACINRYIDVIKSNSTNLKPVEQEVDNDLKEYKLRTNGAAVEGFLQGYYDALLMVKKCLYNSKLARLQVLSNRVKQ